MRQKKSPPPHLGKKGHWLVAKEKKVHRLVVEEKINSTAGWPEKKKLNSQLAREKNSTRILCPRLPPRSLMVRP